MMVMVIVNDFHTPAAANHWTGITMVATTMSEITTILMFFKVAFKFPYLGVVFYNKK